MSRVYDSLRRLGTERRSTGAAATEAIDTVDLLKSAITEAVELRGTSTADVAVPPGSDLVALTDTKCLAAEKFRALVTRLDYLRNERELRSLLVTSSVFNEGKTLVSGNLAVTLAQYTGARILLVGGDLHKPTLASLFGLGHLRGLSQWWSAQGQNIASYVHKLSEMPLWFLSAGGICSQPSSLFQSERFTEAFTRLSGYFDWIIVDAPPMLPTVDVNLWLRLVDGMLLVVREGVAPIKALEKGLASLDNPKLVGVVLNETSDFLKYGDRYYDSPGAAKNKS